MIERIQPWLPTDPDPRFLIASGAGAFIGVVLWLCGARFSRYLVTLGGVAVGAYAGRIAPRVFEWTVDPMGPAFALALVLGGLAFVSHRVVVAWLLGVMLAGCAVLGVWHAHGAPPVALPPGGHLWTPDVYASELWAGVPPDVQRVGPHAALIGIVVGWGVALLWPRVGLVWLYSLVGLIVAMFMGLCLVNAYRPSLLEVVPPQPLARGAIGVGLLLVGILAQWAMLPKPKEKYQQPSLEAAR